MSSVSAIDENSLGKEQFFRLFITQMTMQNPMDPMSTEGFLAQLAQFSSLEQMSNLNSNFEKLLTGQEGTRAVDLVGKTIAYQNPETEAPSGGRVTGVQLNADGAVLLLGNKQVNFDWVTAVFE